MASGFSKLQRVILKALYDQEKGFSARLIYGSAAEIAEQLHCDLESTNEAIRTLAHRNLAHYYLGKQKAFWAAITPQGKNVLNCQQEQQIDLAEIEHQTLLTLDGFRRKELKRARQGLLLGAWILPPEEIKPILAELERLGCVSTSTDSRGYLDAALTAEGRKVAENL